MWGKASTRNSVAGLVDEAIKLSIIEVIRKSERVVMVKIMLEDEILNIVSAYMIHK